MTIIENDFPLKNTEFEEQGLIRFLMVDHLQLIFHLG